MLALMSTLDEEGDRWWFELHMAGEPVRMLAKRATPPVVPFGSACRIIDAAAKRRHR